MVAAQAFLICAGYLVVGLLAEVLRRAGVAKASKVTLFLDGLPIAIMRQVGALEPYLSATALNRLTPFWNRVLLIGFGLTAIVLQATLVGTVMVVISHFTRRRPARR